MENKSIVKKNKGGLFEDLFRKLTDRVAIQLSKTKIIPNQITIASLFVVVAAFYFLVRDYPRISGVLIFVYLFFDNVDGALARISNRVSKLGAFLDKFVDTIADSLLIFGVTYALFVQIYNPVYMFLGFAALASMNILNTILIYSEKDLGGVGKSVRGNKGFISKLTSLGLNPRYLVIDRVLSVLIISVGVFLNQLLFILLFFAVVNTIYWVLLLALILLGTRSSSEN